MTAIGTAASYAAHAQAAAAIATAKHKVVSVGSNLTFKVGIVSLTASNIGDALGYVPFNPSNNLSDLTSASTARTNLRLEPLATLSYGAGLSVSTGNLLISPGAITATMLVAGAAIASLGYAPLNSASNLSDIASASLARANLGLGGAATVNVGNLTGTVASGNDNRIVNAVQLSTLGISNGVATLNTTGKLTPAHMPAVTGLNIGTAGALVTNGGALGTPSSAVLGNATGLPWDVDITGKPTTVSGYGITDARLVLDSASALATYTVPVTINALSLNGYAAAGDLGAGLYRRISTPSTVMPWHHQSADGAWWQLNVAVVTPFHFGAVGNNSNDDWLAAQTAIDYAQTFLKKMSFPRANYVFSKMLTVSVPIDITSDQSATMRWTNPPSVSLPEVSSISVSGRTATITFASAHGLVVNQRIILIGFTPNRYGDEARTVLTAPSSTTVTVDVPPDIGNMTAAGTAKAMDATLPTVSSITVLGTTATITFAAAHGLLTGQSILLAGFTSANFNSTFTILTAPSATTATFKIASGTGNATVIGKAFLRNDGVLIDLRDAGSRFGLNNIELPQLYSSGISSAFAMESYPTTWTGLGRIGDAITLWGGSRITIHTQYVAGWGSRVNIEGTSDATNGLVSPENIDVYGNTDDLNIMGTKINGGPKSSDSLGPISVVSNTSFAKYPLFIRSNNGAVNELSVRINQVFTNETNGAGVYEDGSQTNGTTIRFDWLYAGKGGDSPTGTSSSLTLPYVAGSNPSNGSTTDGNATVGYFGGYNNTLEIGYAAALYGSPGGFPPGSGYVTRIRDAGNSNTIRVKNYPIGGTQSAFVCSSTQGEAHFNGGVGGASFSRLTVLSLAVPTLSAGATAIFYFYHSFLAKGLQKPLRAVPVSNAFGFAQYQVALGDDSGSVNREGYILLKNNTGSTITGATYLVYLEVVE